MYMGAAFLNPQLITDTEGCFTGKNLAMDVCFHERGEDSGRMISFPVIR